MNQLPRVLIVIMGFSLGLGAEAFEPTQGEFVVREDCAATVSIKRPGEGTPLARGRYQAIGLNKPDGEFLQIRVPDARPELRWVRLSCGELIALGALRANPTENINRPKAGKLLLSLSWQPAFCESSPDKTECRTQTPSRYDADHFSLHGLWPQPQGLEYCDVSPLDRATDQRRRWNDLPRVNLESDTAQRLNRVMPGTRSALERHEWVRHGSCFGSEPETYYRTALSLVDQVNSSKLREALIQYSGRSVSVMQLKTAFETSFGEGAGRALGIRCSRDGQRRLIAEIRIQLKQPVKEATPIRAALDTSSPAPGNCDAGVVDQVGLD